MASGECGIQLAPAEMDRGMTWEFPGRAHITELLGVLSTSLELDDKSLGGDGYGGDGIGYGRVGIYWGALHFAAFGCGISGADNRAEFEARGRGAGHAEG